MKTGSLRDYISDHPDFPVEGVVFRDISPILAEPEAFKTSVEAMAAQVDPDSIDTVVGIDARGFIFGGVLASHWSKGLVLCRKPSKLPGELATREFGYEYSSGALSIQREAVRSGDRVMIVDDVLATGNTALAAHQLVEELGGTVTSIDCLLELAYLPGRELLEENIGDTAVHSVIRLEE